MTVAELSERMSSKELTEWLAYYSLEPFGNEIENYRAGVISSTIANVVPGRKTLLKPSDFFPKEVKPETSETMVEKAKLIALMANANKRKK